MMRTELNRPLSSYLIVQSALVLVVLAASHVLHGLLSETAGLEVSRLAVSIFLVLLTQLPVAILFAHNEARNLTQGEGWILGMTFVGFTIGAESGLQMLIARWWPIVARRNGLGPEMAQDAIVFGVCITLMVFLLLSFFASALFRLSVRNNLAASRRSDQFQSRKLSKSAKVMLVQRAVCVASAGLGGVGVAWAVLTGWTLAYALALVVLALGIVYGALPRVLSGRRLVWGKLWREALPIVLTGAMTWSCTTLGMGILLRGGLMPELISAFFPGLSSVATASLVEIAAQMSGVFLGVLCANVAVIWCALLVLRPLLSRVRSSRPVQKPIIENAEPTLFDGGDALTVIPREEAMEMMRMARDLMKDFKPVTRRPSSNVL